MKQVLLGLTAVVFYVAAPGSYASAQSKENIIAYVANSYEQHYESAVEKNSTEVYANDISIKAKRNFTRSFENITDEKWYRIKDGYFVSFSKNDIKTEVYYNARGTWLYNLLTYHQDQLGSQVKNLVKEKLNGYTILTAFEYQFSDGPVYIIKMQNTNTCKTVVVCDNELQVIEEFTKG